MIVKSNIVVICADCYYEACSWICVRISIGVTFRNIFREHVCELLGCALHHRFLRGSNGIVKQLPKGVRIATGYSRDVRPHPGVDLVRFKVCGLQIQWLIRAGYHVMLVSDIRKWLTYSTHHLSSRIRVAIPGRGIYTVDNS